MKEYLWSTAKVKEYLWSVDPDQISTNWFWNNVDIFDEEGLWKEIRDSTYPPVDFVLKYFDRMFSYVSELPLEEWGRAESKNEYISKMKRFQKNLTEEILAITDYMIEYSDSELLEKLDEVKMGLFKLQKQINIKDAEKANKRHPMLSDEWFERNQKVINISDLCRDYILDEDFMRKYAKVLDWANIKRFQRYSRSFAEEFKSKLDIYG